MKSLQKRAIDKNPDEFYFHMIRSRTEDGVHIDTPKEEECTPEQLKLMQTQDLKYISHKRLVESRKIDKLQSQLHLIDADKPNNHVFFVETKDEGKVHTFSQVGMTSYLFVRFLQLKILMSPRDFKRTHLFSPENPIAQNSKI